MVPAAMRYRFALLCILVLPGTPADGEGALRCVRKLGERCWAVGDGGTVLLSDDRGETWRAVEAGSRANFESVSSDGSSVFLFGGSGVPGHPEGFGTGAIYRTDDGGETFHPVAGPAGGWLYGGRFAGTGGGVFGQASPRAPGGIWRTATAGRMWKPVPTEGTGSLRAGAFRSIQYAYLVGGRQRIVALRGLAEPRRHPPQRAGATGLRAVAFADAETCYAVGENGIILRSRPSPVSWMPVDPALPVGTRRLADFEAVAFASPREGWIGGGLLGVVLHTTNAGATWTPLPAPVPGPIHALVHLGGGALLAAGDAGRIWRSTDAGKSWKLTHGAERTDVLFVIAPGDLSVYPAIVAHATAGCNVAVLYAATAPAHDGVPGDQPLRAAAVAAGARGVTVLGDFRSLTLAGENETLSSGQILSVWSKILDVPSRPELLRQIAAAIRLYRPRVLAVGPGPEVGRGRLAENHLIARLGRRAAELAMSDEHLPELEKVGLPPWTVKRVFVGIASNEDWLAPWESQPPVDLSEARVRIDAAVFPRGETTSLEMLAQRAVWCVPGFGLLDRPRRYTGYTCAGERRRLGLFTTGLTKARRRLRTPGKKAVQLAGATPLRAVLITGSVATALPGLVSAAREARDDPLGPDRLLLAWARLLDEGRFVHAEQARDAFLKHGALHPLFARMNVFALAAGVSGEWNDQRRALDARRAKHPPSLSAAVNTFATRPLWNEAPPGMMLHAKALIAASRVPEGKEVLERLARRS